MFHRCCVTGCNSRRKVVKLFKFPQTEIGLYNWSKCVPGAMEKSFSELRKLFVCEKHFEKRFLTKKFRLKNGSYPSLFDADEMARGFPKAPIDAIMQPPSWTKNRNEHDYCKMQHNDHNYAKESCASTSTDTGMPSDIEMESLALTSSDVNIPVSTTSEVEMLSPGTPNTVKDTDMPSDIEMEPLALTSSDVEVSPYLSNIEEITSQATSDVDMLPPGTPNISRVKDNFKQCSFIVTPKIRRFKIRKRLIQRKAILTPNCRRLYKEYSKSQKQLNFCKRAKRALICSKEKSFEKLTENISPVARKMLWMQIKQSNKRNKGRRYTDEEKLISLSILKQSPKCYRFLQKIFILPSKQTLNKFITELTVEPGINQHLFSAISDEVRTWKSNRKYCTVIFDEVALEPGLSYDKHKDVIEGFVELKTKTNDFADHALVFMLRGAIHKWQQPVAFYFCKGATPAIELKYIIKNIVAAVIDTGLIPVALVSDQGTAFQSALNQLLQESRREQICAGREIDDVVIIKKYRLSVIYDPPHLFKGLRNNFLNKNISCNGKIAKWSDIVQVYKADCKHAEMRLLHKLNDEHVIPEKVKKMKVKNCARVFSQTMAAALTYTAQFSEYSDGTPVSDSLRNTAEVVGFFDKLFDSVNGASFGGKNHKGKPLRTAVTKNSPHHNFWREAINILSKMTYVINGKEVSVPTLRNWIVTLKSYIRLWQFFEQKNIKIMRPRYFNSDPLENFFGQVRAYNYRNINPDCHTFKCTFRSLLVTRFIKFHSEGFNCEEDSADQLLKLKSLFNKGNPSQNSIINIEGLDEEFPNLPVESSNKNVNPESSHSAARYEKMNVHSQAYTAGWVIRKILENIKCTTCEANLKTREKHAVHEWITIREYESTRNNHNKLTYPAEQSIRLFKYIKQEAIEYLEREPQQSKILNNIKTIVKTKYEMDFLKCETHENIADLFLDYTLRLTIFNWCTVINKILKGTDISRLNNKLPLMQQKAYDKFKTKLRNKKLNKY